VSPERVALSWIIVAHDSRDDLAGLLPELGRALGALRERGFQSELLVADSGSSDGSAELARRHEGVSEVLECGDVGFGAAANRAGARCRGDWLAISNADLGLPAGGLDELPGVLARAGAEVALIGPAVRRPEGCVEASTGRFPTLLRLLRGSALPAAGATPPPGPLRVDWVTGACCFVRRQAFDAVGGFDAGFFLYYEDVDLALRLRQRGLFAAYEPSVTVVHRRPHHRRPRESRIESLIERSRSTYFRRHRPAWEAVCLAGVAGVRRWYRTVRGRSLTCG
jgi:N-acetylglucosaminyl-diphospho-decaprenol L-rhamnosyltransferase